MAAGELAGFRLTPMAERDLEDIWLYTARTWSADQADTYVDGLVRTIGTLVAMPTLARERDAFDPPVRIHPSGQHLIVYRVEDVFLIVIRILGGRQDWRAILETMDA